MKRTGAFLLTLALAAAPAQALFGKKKKKRQEDKPAVESVAAIEPVSEPDPAVTLLEKDPSGCQWLESKAAISFGRDDTKAQARAGAIAEARTLAMNKFLGVTLSHQTVDFQQEGLRGDASMVQSLLRTTQHGRITDEKVLSHGPQDRPNCPACMYGAHIRLCIVPKKDSADKDFHVELSLNHTRFRHGDQAEIRVTPSKDSYIYLYNIHGDWDAALMFPSAYAKENLVKGGATFVYPSEEMKQAYDARLDAEVPEGASIGKETLRVIASKSPLPESILEGPKGHSRKKMHASTEMTGGGKFTQFMRRLIESDLEWVDDNVAFTIYKD